jgi:molybdopterin-guanine dinucleotide biosynthesis protein A
MSLVIDSVILAGGASSRFGSNKMLHLIDGVMMTERVVQNMQIDSVPYLVGADEASASSLGRLTLKGPREGEGPLGALIDCLERSSATFLLVAPCDTPFFTSEDFSRLVHAITPGGDVSVATNSRNHWLLSCWNRTNTFDHLSAQFAAGERAVHRAVIGLQVVEVDVLESNTRNINAVSDL